MKKTRSKKQGRLTTNNVIMEPHEYATINVLLCSSEDVELVRKSRTPHTSSPDIVMRGMFWEMKSPKGETLRSIDRILHRASHQAQNIVIDLRRTKFPEELLIAFLEKEFYIMRSVRNMWIITKNVEIIKLKK